MQAWLHGGFIGTSDFSGNSGWESAIEELMVGLIAFGFQVPDGCWHWHSYSDIKRSSQMVAVACRQRSGPCVGPSHVFGDVLHRFPREVQEDLHKKSPTLKTPKEDALLQFLACRAVIESEISSFRPQLSPCFVHGKCCNPRPPVESLAHLISLGTVAGNRP